MQIHFTKKGITLNAFQSQKEIILASFAYDEKLAEDFKKKEETIVFNYGIQEVELTSSVKAPLKNETALTVLSGHFDKKISTCKINLFFEKEMLRKTDCIVRNFPLSDNPFIIFEIALNSRFLTLFVNKKECFLFDSNELSIQGGLDYEQVYYSFSDLLGELKSLPF